MWARSLLASVIAATLSISAALAEPFVYLWNPPAGGQESAGRVTAIEASYDADEKLLSFAITAVEANGEKPVAFVLVLTEGPTTPFLPGEYAELYFDASHSSSDPDLLVYAYNQPAPDPFYERSWEDGDGTQPGSQAPDKILSSRADGSWVVDAAMTDYPDGSRVLSFLIDLTEIDSHLPLYLMPGVTWKSMRIGESVGFAMEAFNDPDSQYDAQGWLTKWLPPLASAYCAMNQCEEGDPSGAQCGVPDCLGVPGGTATFDSEGTCCEAEEIDLCGICFGDNTSCLGCIDSDIGTLQLELDGRAHDQLALVRGVTGRLVRKDKSAANRSFSKKLRAQAKALVEESWELLYSIPKVVTQCTNQVLCFQSDVTGVEATYRANNQALFMIATKAIKRYERATGRAAKKFRRRNLSLVQSNEIAANSLPDFVSDCF